MSPVGSNEGKAIAWDVPCDIQGVRDASSQLRRFLAHEGLNEEDQNSWELVCMEAAANAVRYCAPDATAIPLKLRAMVTPVEVEVQITDHTPGFEWPDDPELPDNQSENGRGLFLIKALTDSVRYFRNRTANCLILSRQRKETIQASETNPLTAKIEELEGTLNVMTEEIAACYESLTAIFRFTTELGHKNQGIDFASRWLNQLIAVAGVDWYIFRAAEEEGKRLTTVAASRPEYEFGPLTIPEDPSGVNPIELQAVLNRQDLWVESNTALSPDDPLRQAGRFAAIISHPVFLQNQLAGVLTVGRAAGGSAFNAGHVNIIHTFADFLGIQLRNVRIQEENVSSRLVTREVEIAATIQRSLLPEHLPEPPGFRLSGYSQSASGVGGDFYDAIQLEDGSLLMAMADVMGKGVPAAMFAAIFRSHVRARTDLASRPAEFMKWLNSTLYHDLDRVEMFVTAQLIHVDWQKRELKLAAAGHCPALLAVNGKEIWEIVAEGPPLGVDQSPFYDSTSFILPRNARLMMFTDGLVDARNESDGFFGMERVKRWFRESVEHQEPVRSASDRLIRQIADFRGDRSATDDITLLLLAEQRDIDD